MRCLSCPSVCHTRVCVETTELIIKQLELDCSLGKFTDAKHETYIFRNPPCDVTPGLMFTYVTAGHAQATHSGRAQGYFSAHVWQRMTMARVTCT